MSVCVFVYHQRVWQRYESGNGRESKSERVSKLKGLSVCLLDCDRLFCFLDLQKVLLSGRSQRYIKIF